MKHSPLTVCVLLAVLVYVAPGETSFKPTLLHLDDGPAFVPALRIKSTQRTETDLGRPDRFLFAEYDLAGSLSTKSKLNTERTALDLRGGFDWRFDAVTPVRRTFPNPGGAASTASAASRRSKFRWGSISTELAAGYETDESLDNRQSAYGLRFNYTPAFDRAASQWWMPNLWLDYRRIDETGSSIATRLGVQTQNYWRFGSKAFWQLTVPAWRGVKIVPGFQYYSSTDLALARQARDLDDDAYSYSLALDYAIPEASTWGKYFSGVRLEIADGRVPPVTTSRTTVALAFTVKWGDLLK